MERMFYLFHLIIIGWSCNQFELLFFVCFFTVMLSCIFDLTLKQLANVFQNVILVSYVMVVWNWSNAMDVYLVLWILMAWCFSTRTSVATVLSMYPCTSSCLWANLKLYLLFSVLTHCGLLTTYGLIKFFSSLVLVVACCLIGAKSLPKPMLTYCQLDPY